jgi:RTX calcium-binding nonapeptide repeat (4 copies)
MRGAFTARRGRSARVATIAGLALLAVPASALADTKVSLEDGPIGNGVSGDYVWVTDPVSIGDKPMEVFVTRAGSKIKVTDAAGDVRVGAGCERSGAAVLCPAGLEGLRIEGGDNNDVLTNDADLPSAMFGDGGKDDLQGGSNKDRMSGQEGIDHLRGGDARDTFSLESGTDAIDGEWGTDVITYSSASVILTWAGAEIVEVAASAEGGGGGTPDFSHTPAAAARSNSGTLV